MKKSKKIIISILIILLVVGGVVGFILLKPKPNSDTKDNLSNELTLKDLEVESGSSVPSVSDFISSGVIEGESEITFENTDETLDDKTLQTMTLIIDDEEGIVDTCPEGKTCEEQVILTGTGTYKVSITINDETMEATLTVVDTIAPTIEVNEEVTITQDETVTVASFVKSCADNSHTDCNFRVVDMENTDVDVAKLAAGTHKLVLVVTDDASNEVRKEVVLTINKKEESKTSSSSSSNSSNKTSSSSSSNKNTSSSSGSNSSSNKNTSSGSSNSSSNTGSSSGSSSNGSSSSSGSNSSSSSSTCSTYKNIVTTSVTIKGSDIGKTVPFYHRFSTPVHYSVADEWYSKNPVMELLNREINRMPILALYETSGHTNGGMYEVECNDGSGKIAGFVVLVEYYPQYWADSSQTSTKNDKLQGRAYLNSSKNPVWIFRNFRDAWNDELNVQLRQLGGY